MSTIDTKDYGITAYQTTNDVAKKTIFIEVEVLNFTIEVIFEKNKTGLLKIINEIPTEYRNILKDDAQTDKMKSQLKAGLSKDGMVEFPNVLDYFFYIIDNNLQKCKFIITEKPDKEEFQDITCLAFDLLDDILERKGMDIACEPNQERQMRNEVGSYIAGKIWAFCENKI